MAYIAPIHRASSVRHALWTRLLSADEPCLVLAKGNRLEMWRLSAGDEQTPPQLTLAHTQAVHGTIAMLQALRPRGQEDTAELLFVGTDRFEYFTATWDASSSRLRTEQIFRDEGERHLRATQSVNKCLVDPSGTFMVMHLWEGVMSVLRVPPARKQGKRAAVESEYADRLRELAQVRIHELFVRASTFLYTQTGHPKIALLYQTTGGPSALASAAAPSSAEPSGAGNNPSSSAAAGGGAGASSNNNQHCGDSRARVVAYRLTADDANNEAARFDPTRGDRELDMEVRDGGATLLIPVPYVAEERHARRYVTRNPDPTKPHMGGLIVVGETTLLYAEDGHGQWRAKIRVPLREANVFVAWCRLDDTRYFLADDYGRLHLLTLHVAESAVVADMTVQRLVLQDSGQREQQPKRDGDDDEEADQHQGSGVSRAGVLVYLGNDLLFVGSHHGDSQLFRIRLGDCYTSAGRLDPDTAGSLVLLQTMSNIGPVLDFAVMDMGASAAAAAAAFSSDPQAAAAAAAVGSEYSSGQARIVTGSGVHADGTLRSIRSGVGLEDIGILANFENVRGLFSLRSFGAAKDDTLAISFLTDTRVFRFDAAGEVEELEAAAAQKVGIDTDSVTLVARNLPTADASILRVTPSEVAIIDAESGVSLSSWHVPEGRLITSASANDAWVLLSLDGTTLVTLRVDGEQLGKGARRDTVNGDQVACVHVSPHAELDVGVVGFWSSATIAIVDLATLNARHGESLRRTDDSPSVPRDIVLAQVLPPRVGGMTLFVSLEDGYAVTMNVCPEDYSLSGRKSVVLGTRHARLFPLPQPSGLYNVFVTSEHSSLIFGSEGRIVYSAVTAEDATYVCPFDSEAFPNAMVVATEAQVKISLVDNERRAHVTTLRMGETVRRIVYSPLERVFMLGCIRRELWRNEEVVSSSVRLVDEVVFAPVGAPLKLESGTGAAVEIVETIARAELRDSYGNPAERFLLGTSFLAESDVINPGPVRGRILAIGVDSERNPYVVATHDLKGNCRSILPLGDRDPAGSANLMVAALSRSVVVFSYRETSTTSGDFIRLASFRPSTYPVELAVHGYRIAVVDLMKSVALLEFRPAKRAVAAEDDKDVRMDDDDEPKRIRRKRATAGNETKAKASGTSSGGDSSEPQLVELARHYQAIWGTAAAYVEDDSWLEADAEGNLLMLRYDPAALLPETRRRLQVIAEYNLGENVNRIRTIDVKAGPNAPVLPKAFLATVRHHFLITYTTRCHCY